MHKPIHKLVFADTGKVCPVGSSLHAVDPVGQPYVWKLVTHHVNEDHHEVVVSRHHPRIGRIHRRFHPKVFGLVIELDVVWYRDIRHTAHKARVRFGDWLMAGLVALIPLAFFERLHWAEDITKGFASVASMFGMDTGSGGH